MEFIEEDPFKSSAFGTEFNKSSVARPGSQIDDSVSVCHEIGDEINFTTRIDRQPELATGGLLKG